MQAYMFKRIKNNWLIFLWSCCHELSRRRTHKMAIVPIQTVFSAPANLGFTNPKLAWFRNVLLKQCMMKGHAEFLEWLVSVSAALFSISVSMKLWKPLLEMSSCSQRKCFPSSHLFSICGDSRNDLYIPPYYTFIQPAERGWDRLVACFWWSWYILSPSIEQSVHPQICGGGRASCCDSKYSSAQTLPLHSVSLLFHMCSFST